MVLTIDEGSWESISILGNGLVKKGKKESSLNRHQTKGVHVWPWTQPPRHPVQGCQAWEESRVRAGEKGRDRMREYSPRDQYSRVLRSFILPRPSERPLSLSLSLSLYFIFSFYLLSYFSLLSHFFEPSQFSSSNTSCWNPQYPYLMTPILWLKAEGPNSILRRHLLSISNKRLIRIKLGHDFCLLRNVGLHKMECFGKCFPERFELIERKLCYINIQLCQFMTFRDRIITWFAVSCYFNNYTRERERKRIGERRCGGWKHREWMSALDRGLVWYTSRWCDRVSW